MDLRVVKLLLAIVYCISNEIDLFQNYLKNISFALKFIFYVLKKAINLQLEIFIKPNA